MDTDVYVIRRDNGLYYSARRADGVSNTANWADHPLPMTLSAASRAYYASKYKLLGLKVFKLTPVSEDILQKPPKYIRDYDMTNRRNWKRADRELEQLVESYEREEVEGS